MKIARLPDNDKTNAWNTILPEREGHSALDQSITADWLVVGAGYAGLSAARRLAENRPDEKIVLLDAGLCGENASGRNSGFAIDVPHTVSSNLDQLDAAHRHLRLARTATSELERLVHQYDIRCDWSQDGKYQAAVTPQGEEAMLQPFAAELDKLDEPYEWVRGVELRAKLGTAHFHSAVYTPGCILMNPAALVRGLIDNLPENVRVYENTPVLEFHRENGVRVNTPNGEVRAARMILATNGFSEQFGFLDNHFVHLEAHASLTRPLTTQEQQDYGVTQAWGLTPANAFSGITMRYTNDHRILIRQDIRVSTTQSVSTTKQHEIAQQHKRLFDDRFPSLPEVSMENTWTGYLCMSRNSAPAFGKVASNVWIAACQNGIGVTKGTISGQLVADMACERDNPLIADMQQLGEPEKLPPPLFTNIGARVKLGYELWRNRHEA